MTGTWEQLIRAWSEWHAATFPPRRVTGEKLREEVEELIEHLECDDDYNRIACIAEEGADVLMVLIRTLDLNGVMPERLLEECWRKLEINKSRTWTVVDGVERHVKHEGEK